TGGRVIVSFCRVGGVQCDLTPEQVSKIISVCDEIEDEIRKTGLIFINDTSVKNRLRGVGYISKEDAAELCAVGPTARGSGIDNDVRSYTQSYRDLGFEPILYDEGDCLARCRVRIDELMQSLDIIRNGLRNLPGGEWRVPVKGNPPAGEYAFRVEQPRGEAFYYVKGNGTKNLDRARVRTPTNINIPAMVRMLQGCSLQDVSMIVITIDPCISCTER
ncbi:MAG: NADH-quinone oxidoreductase subunit D, partial [Thermoplasmata archaeon]|nr:NADH-quinone oxidoreductase subunit D [Thermoplasmata archaeon]